MPATPSRASPLFRLTAPHARASPEWPVPISKLPSLILARPPPRPVTDSDRTASYAVGTNTSEGQRFRVLRPHAKGGLGAVFVALDVELHREVALKQILDRHADDPISRQRFLLEAEVTGGLEHPGIVPVYGLGTYDGGRPYYAMRFIRGDSLKEAIDQFHANESLNRDPGRGRWNCASCSGDSSTSATQSTTPTAAACCTGTSSRPISLWASTARPWSSIGGWPR